MTTTIRRSGGTAIFAILFLFASQMASAALVQGDYLGTFEGNASEAQLMADLGLLVEELAKVDWPGTSNEGLSISDLVLDSDNEPTSGDWSYGGAGVVDIIVIKAGTSYAAYLLTDANTDGMRNMGIWDTLDVDGKGLSHISAYRVVPVPAAVWLFGSALFGLGLVRRRR